MHPYHHGLGLLTLETLSVKVKVNTDTFLVNQIPGPRLLLGMDYHVHKQQCHGPCLSICLSVCLSVCCSICHGYSFPQVLPSLALPYPTLPFLPGQSCRAACFTGLLLPAWTGLTGFPPTHPSLLDCNSYGEGDGDHDHDHDHDGDGDHVTSLYQP